MSTEGAKKRWEHMVSNRYEPVGMEVGTGVNESLRVAHALEYIAAQMGEINHKLAIIVEQTGGPDRSRP